ncbi:MAG: phycobilisome linker polypeptide [Waterburya sp.]
MSGMITTGDTNISTYGGRTIAIEVTGVCRQDVVRTSSYTVKVPYSRMSQTIRNINRMGGKIASVSLGGASPVEAATPDAPAVEQHQEQPKKRFGRRKNRDRE